MKTFACTLLCLWAAPVAAQDCSAYQKQMDDVQPKYKTLYEAYQSDGQKLKKEAEASATFNVTWADTKIVFDTPTVTMKDQKITLGLPQVTMKMQAIIFDTPSATMVPTKIAQYPELTCDHALIPSCTVKWSDVITNIPQTFMQRQTIETYIPEFTFEDTSFIMGIPEFSMQRQEIVMGLPQFELKEAHLNAKELEDRGKSLGQRISATKEQQLRDVSVTTNQMFACIRNNLNLQKSRVSATFEEGISKLTASINYLKQIGADPTDISDSTGRHSNLVKQLAEIVSKREAAFAQFDNAIKSIEDEERQTVSKLTSA